MADADLTRELSEAVQEAAARDEPLAISAGGSKDFYGGRYRPARRLEVGGHRGVVAYEPTELAITARAGTPLAEIEALLSEHGQQLPFEPPHFGPGASLGGAVAAGLSGPRRPYAGAVRDAVLGARIVNGRGQVLEFGGRVMKNVAGYDLSRLMAGALGTLGLLLELSVKVQPRPRAELTLGRDIDAGGALAAMVAAAGASVGLSAASYGAGRLRLRLGGGERALSVARGRLDGDEEPQGAQYWTELREQRLAYFEDPRPLWRLSLPPATPPLDLAGDWLLDWGGAQRWLKTETPAAELRARAARVGGHATLFRGGTADAGVFTPLPPALLGLHRNLKAALDPRGIFNPGRLYEDL